MLAPSSRVRTRRERIVELLVERVATPSGLAAELDATPAAVVTDLEHVARSLDPDEGELLVAPPTCRDCGFEGFDDLLNRPSRCPECRSESVAEPDVTIR
jgi:predicted Zn-ribbon and HTH transcriptional regulator